MPSIWQGIREPFTFQTPPTSGQRSQEGPGFLSVGLSHSHLSSVSLLTAGGLGSPRHGRSIVDFKGEAGFLMPEVL